MEEHEVKIAHCPLSNYYFAEGTLPLKKLLAGSYIAVGLGTDVAGGYAPSMLSAMRCAVQTAKVREAPRHDAIRKGGCVGVSLPTA